MIVVAIVIEIVIVMIGTAMEMVTAMAALVSTMIASAKGFSTAGIGPCRGVFGREPPSEPTHSFMGCPVPPPYTTPQGSPLINSNLAEGGTWGGSIEGGTSGTHNSRRLSLPHASRLPKLPHGTPKKGLQRPLFVYKRAIWDSMPLWGGGGGGGRLTFPVCRPRGDAWKRMVFIAMRFKPTLSAKLNTTFEGRAGSTQEPEQLGFALRTFYSESSALRSYHDQNASASVSIVALVW